MALLNLFLLVTLIARSISHCVWYGMEKPPVVLYHNYTGDAKPLKDQNAYEIIRHLCPNLDKGNGTKLCCDGEQVKYLSDSLNQAFEMLARCSACWANFRMLMCSMTCSPTHSDFLSTLVNGGNVTRAQFNVTEQLANRFFNSCKDVKFAGNPAIDTICKTSNCSAEKLLTAIGNQAPFPIDFIFKSDDRSAYNESFYSCNESVGARSADRGGPKCSCVDCAASCSPQPPVPPPIGPRKLFGVDLWWCIGGLAFAVFVLAFLICQLGVCLRHRGRDEPTDSQVKLLDASGHGCLAHVRIRLEVGMYRAFRALGFFVARRPFMVLLACLVVCAALASGLALFTVTTNPIELWSGPQSRSRREKNFFDHNFAPFYRTEQIIIRPLNQTPFVHNALYEAAGTAEFGQALNDTILRKVHELQNALLSVKAYSEKLNKTVSLSDICYQPLYPDNLECAVTSPLEYFQNNMTLFNQTYDDGFFVLADYLDHLMCCAESPLTVKALWPDSSRPFSCLASSGIPVLPQLVLGGFNGTEYTQARALVLTILVRNDPDPQSELVHQAEVWEAEYLRQVRQWAQANKHLVKVSYQAERSVEDEINRQSEADVRTVVISYAVMFVYVSLFLASYRSCRTVLVDLRVTLGFGGVLMVIVSVLASMGVWSFARVSATLIIVEVIPFLVLAVGVDNIFILVHAFEFAEDDLEPLPDLEPAARLRLLIERRVAGALGQVGPSILLTGLTEAVAFFFGSLTDMPAVRVFVLYAGVAILFNLMLQLTAFVALLTLDARRYATDRFDVLCCRGLRPSGEREEGDTEGLLPRKSEWRASTNVLHHVMANWFAPALLSRWVRPLVLVGAVGWLCFCGAIVPDGLRVGLDQRLSMPSDSYMVDFFDALSRDLRIGPPVYFVVTPGHDYRSMTGQNLVCGGSGCPNNALLPMLEMAAKQSNYTRIAQGASSWLDDYFDWLGNTDSCCRVYQNDSQRFCPSEAPTTDCKPCDVQLHDGRPTPEQFDKFLPGFLQMNPSSACPKGGRAAYKAGVSLGPDGQVQTSYFMAYHTVLAEPDDYVEAIRGARRLADQVNQVWRQNRSKHDDDDEVLAKDTVFPYSVFYVFYEQYLSVVRTAALQIIACVAAVSLVTLVLLGLDWRATLVVLLGVAYVLISMLGLMVLWDVWLNALSVVNLVVTVGIAVEFCSHIVRAFTTSVRPTRVERAQDALARMGSSILRGITLTKLGGIVVLAYSKSRLFQVFYFRMYLGIIVFGATTGLVVLPVVLSYIGPPLNVAALRRREMEQ